MPAVPVSLANALAISQSKSQVSRGVLFEAQEPLKVELPGAKRQGGAGGVSPHHEEPLKVELQRVTPRKGGTSGGLTEDEASGWSTCVSPVSTTVADEDAVTLSPESASWMACSSSPSRFYDEDTEADSLQFWTQPSEQETTTGSEHESGDGELPPVGMSDQPSPWGAFPTLPDSSYPLSAVPNRGSLLHSTGQCRPCAWFYKPVGCQGDSDCGFCHLCPEGALKAKKKMKLAKKRLINISPFKEEQPRYALSLASLI